MSRAPFHSHGSAWWTTGTRRGAASRLALIGSAGALLLLSVVLLGGCTTVRVVDPATPSLLDRINSEADGRAVRLRFADGREARGTRLVVGPDTMSYVDARGRARSVPTRTVREIRMRYRERGALQGAGLGLLAGAATGAVVGAIFYSESGFSPFTRGEIAAIGAASLGVGGASLGLKVGRERGSRRAYRFRHAPPPHGARPEAAGAAPDADGGGR